jgi:hypothetical protein
MGLATLNGEIFGVRMEPKLPRPLKWTPGGLRRLVAILVAHPGYGAVHTGDGLQEAYRTGPLAGDRPDISARLAAPGFDEPALRAFLGANGIRMLEVVLP